MRFEWDEAKRAANFAKHGVDFAMAALFDLGNSVVEIDARADYGEERLVALGLIGVRVHVLVFTWRDGAMRVIGLRKANARERKRYEDSGQA